MIEPTGIDHICLSVTDLNRAKIYYERVFGAKCRLRKNDPKTIIVEAKNVHFFLSQTIGNSDFISGQHLSFRVTNLSCIIDELKALEITEYKTGTVEFFERNNYRWCEWRDPDGIRLECVELL